MKLTIPMALEVAYHEAIVLEAYRNAGDVWTWSVGLTSASGHDVEQYIDNPAPLRECVEVFIRVLDDYADDVREVFSGHGLSEAQFAAALSFHWNTGAIGTASWVLHWKEGNVQKARKAFMNWSKPKSIIPRRKAERDLFFDGIWANDGSILEYTRVESDHSIDWGSAIRRDIRAAVANALNPPVTLPSEKTPRNAVRGDAAVTAVLGAIAAIVIAVASWFGGLF